MHKYVYANKIHIMLMVMIGFFVSNSTLAEGFKSSDFLGWPRKSQESYIQTSISMAGVVATQTAYPDFASCVDKWFWQGGKQGQGKRQAHILDVMRKYPEFHPQGVILAVLKKQCGDLKPR